MNFDVATNPNTDLVFTQMRQKLAQSQLPTDVRNYGVTVQKSALAPLMIVSAVFAQRDPRRAHSWRTTPTSISVDQLLRVPGVGMVNVFGAGQYAIRIWVRPDALAKLAITVPAGRSMRSRSRMRSIRRGQIGGEPVARRGRSLPTRCGPRAVWSPAEEFGQIVSRANSDGSIVRLKDVARIELGTQDYNIKGRRTESPRRIVALYQMPGTNAIATAEASRK